jgi:hypothetical protein
MSKGGGSEGVDFGMKGKSLGDMDGAQGERWQGISEETGTARSKK